MSKKFFQRLLAFVFILVVIFIDIPSVFKDMLTILLAVFLFLSTFDIFKKKKKIKEGALD